MLTKKNILLLSNTIFLVFLFYFSIYNMVSEVHITELLFLLNCFILYILYGKKNAYFITYLAILNIAQILYTIYICFEKNIGISATGGAIFLIAYASMIIYIFKEIEWGKLKTFSVITAVLILALVLWIAYNINYMILKEQPFSNLENPSEIIHQYMIYIYFIFIASMIFLGFLNLSTKVNSWSILFCLGATCALSSEFSQIFQMIHYGGDSVGFINIIDKAFSVASMYFFYSSIDNRKHPDSLLKKAF